MILNNINLMLSRDSKKKLQFWESDIFLLIVILTIVIKTLQVLLIFISDSKGKEY